MSDDLYDREIIRLARAGTGHGHLENADSAAAVDNPLCGDRVTVEVAVDDGHVAALAHQVRGCVLCEASAAVVGEAGPGETKDGARAAAMALTAMLTSGGAPPGGRWAGLAVFQPVAGHRSRHRCVLLPLEALVEALEN